MTKEKYNHSIIEPACQKFWEDLGIYKFKNDQDRSETFVIDTPPPTVSGLLHMGHVFSYTQADFIARYQRMRGKDVFYPMGFDDNGLPTERLVEKERQVKASNMAREDFVEICKEVVIDAENQFRSFFREIALSVDWDQEYQTISNQSQHLSQLSFIDLYKKGRIYREFAPVYWDVIDQTALAAADIVDRELKSTMNYINLELDNNDIVTIATTRPELIPACVALLYHPDDDRHQQLSGRRAILPITHELVPIISDKDVLQEKGSGLVMCCTFGDITDISWWRRHNLPLKQIVEKNGKIADNIPLIGGEKIKNARAIVLEHLKDKLVRQEDIAHSVKCAERSGEPIEILSTYQWFVKILDLKEKLLKRTRQCNWHPEYMRLRLEQWIEGLAWDWCISRQRYFGVPIPVWYSRRQGEEGKILITDHLPANPLVDLPQGYSRDEVTAETDILDTWATSSISPQLSSQGISTTVAIDRERHAKLFPADLRPQAHEIIRSWAFYTIIKAELHQEQVPWHNLMISGWCLAADKTKMSKSKGNVITPEQLIRDKGSDIVRYWASTSHLGADTAYSETLLSAGNKLINKLWNLASFTEMHQQFVAGEAENSFDKWILWRLSATISKASAEFDKFSFGTAREVVEDFFWNDLCDNYLEIIKVRIYGLAAHKYLDKELTNDEILKIQTGQASAAYTLNQITLAVLKLFAPFVPHITEHLHQKLYFNNDSIHQRGSWPVCNCMIDEALDSQIQNSLTFIGEVRKYKSINNLSLKAEIDEMLCEDLEFVPQELMEDLKNVTGVRKILCH